MSSFHIRWHTVTDRRRSAGERFFAAAELICLPLSFLTFAGLVAEALLGTMGVILVPPGSVWAGWVFPVLSAAAIGYVTNWLAILMLFRPYERHGWFFLWPQGLLPRNKARMAKELGQAVGGRLLAPEKLVGEFAAKATDFLARPEVVGRFREVAQEVLTRHADGIAGFLAPHVGEAAEGLLGRMLTPERLRAFWDETLAPRLNDESVREVVAGKIIEVVRASAPELARAFQGGLRNHLRKALGRTLIGQFGGTGLIDGVVEVVMAFFADEASIREKVSEWLQKPETAALLREKLLLFGEQAGEWLRSSEGKNALERFADDIKGKVGEALSAGVRQALPGLLRQAIAAPALWAWIGTTALPDASRSLTAHLAAHRDEIAAKLDLPRRIEEAVNAQSIPEFHAMLDRLAARHLGAIQVLGYFLGALVGVLQCV